MPKSCACYLPKRAVIFCTSVAHSNLTEWLQHAGSYSVVSEIAGRGGSDD